MRSALWVLFLFLSGFVFSNQTDATKVDTAVHLQIMDDITIVGRSSKMDVQQMPEIVGTSIYAGKKSALIVMDNVMGNVVNNTMRQVLAKVPGIHIWENDGSGIQIGIAARGLSPNRSWEFNVRQNGYDITADPYGYPEAYYNPPLQSVQRIEIIRGHGALQYGPQFGGMVNYILRNGTEMTKKVEMEFQQSFGSNKLFNTYSAIGGNSKKLHYYTFFDHRNADGFRNNSRFFTNAGFATLTYKINKQIAVTAEYMKSHIRSQQPGGLLDKDFSTGIRKSYRSRNWMDVDWTTIALIAKWKPHNSAELNVKLFGLYGDRSSVGFMPSGGIIIADTNNSRTGQFNPRNLNTDRYRNYGLEIRALVRYELLGNEHHVSSGLRFYKGNTHRLVADGKGSVGSNYDMRVDDGLWTRDLNFSSFNTAAFIENIFKIGRKYRIIPGVRFEYIEGTVSGRNGFEATLPVLLQDQSRSRAFLLSGIGATYHAGKLFEVYSNISQAYRPIQFADLAAPPTTEVIDQQLKDAKGYNADLGFRGKYGDAFIVDASIYYLKYNNRIGTMVQQRLDGSFYQFRTNVGSSNSKGVEALVSYCLFRKYLYPKKWEMRIFSSLTLNDSRYGDFKVIGKNNNHQLEVTNLRNKRVEHAPNQMIRTGVTVGYKNISVACQLSYTSETYSDANNTLHPNGNSSIGLIPGYSIYDATVVWGNRRYNMKAGINNLTNEVYFTRRAGGYPGPGAMPADGRSFFVTWGAKF